MLIYFAAQTDITSFSSLVYSLSSNYLSICTPFFFLALFLFMYYLSSYLLPNSVNCGKKEHFAYFFFQQAIALDVLTNRVMMVVKIEDGIYFRLASNCLVHVPYICVLSNVT